MISRLADLENGSLRYVLGLEPDILTLYDLVNKQYDKFCGKKTTN